MSAGHCFTVSEGDGTPTSPLTPQDTSLVSAPAGQPRRPVGKADALAAHFSLQYYVAALRERSGRIYEKVDVLVGAPLPTAAAMAEALVAQLCTRARRLTPSDFDEAEHVGLLIDAAILRLDQQPAWLSPLQLKTALTEVLRLCTCGLGFAVAAPNADDATLRSPVALLRAASLFFVAAVNVAAPDAVFDALLTVFPDVGGRVLAARHPVLTPLLYDFFRGRCAAAHVVCELLSKHASKLAAAAEQKKSKRSASFTSISARYAQLLLDVNTAVLAAVVHANADGVNTMSRSVMLNTLGTVMLLTPYARVPSAATAVSKGLLQGELLLRLLSDAQQRQNDVAAALFALTALHRNKHAAAMMRSFYATPRGAETITAVLRHHLSSVEGWRVVSSLCKDHPGVVVRDADRWATVEAAAAVAIASAPPAERGADRIFVVERPTRDSLGRPAVQRPTEAMRAVLQAMGPFGPQLDDTQWAAELSAGHASHQEVQGGVVTSASARMPNMPSEPGVVEQKSAPAEGRLQPAQRARLLDPVVLRARRSGIDGVRRLGFKALAHLGNATLAELPAERLATIVAAVTDEGLCEPRSELDVDVLLTLSAWARYYPLFLSGTWLETFCDRVLLFARDRAGGIFVTRAVCLAAESIATAAHARASLPGGRALSERRLLDMLQCCFTACERFPRDGAAVGRALQCASAVLEALPVESLILEFGGNEEGVTNEVLQRILRCMERGDGVNAARLAPMRRHSDPSRQPAIVVAACSAIGAALRRPDVRDTDPESVAATASALTWLLKRSDSFAERTAAARTAGMLQLDAPTIPAALCDALVFAQTDAHRGSITDVRELKKAVEDTLLQLAARHGAADLASVDAATPLGAAIEKYNDALVSAGVLQLPPRAGSVQLDDDGSEQHGGAAAAPPPAPDC